MKQKNDVAKWIASMDKEKSDICETVDALKDAIVFLHQRALWGDFLRFQAEQALIRLGKQT